VDIKVGERKGGVDFIVMGSVFDSEENRIHVSHLKFNAPAISYDFSGRSVSVAGDINGDGYNDLIIGVPFDNVCYVMFGTKHGFANMTQGFVILGASDGDLTGWSVSNAGLFVSKIG
jgi:hypothetical protein